MVKLSQSKRKPPSKEITALPHHNLTAIPEEVVNESYSASNAYSINCTGNTIT